MFNEDLFLDILSSEENLVPYQSFFEPNSDLPDISEILQEEANKVPGRQGPQVNWSQGLPYAESNAQDGKISKTQNKDLSADDEFDLILNGLQDSFENNKGVEKSAEYRQALTQFASTEGLISENINSILDDCNDVQSCQARPLGVQLESLDDLVQSLFGHEVFPGDNKADEPQSDTISLLDEILGEMDTSTKSIQKRKEVHEVQVSRPLNHNANKPVVKSKPRFAGNAIFKAVPAHVRCLENESTDDIPKQFQIPKEPDIRRNMGPLPSQQRDPSVKRAEHNIYTGPLSMHGHQSSSGRHLTKYICHQPQSNSVTAVRSLQQLRIYNPGNHLERDNLPNNQNQRGNIPAPKTKTGGTLSTQKSTYTHRQNTSASVISEVKMSVPKNEIKLPLQNSDGKSSLENATFSIAINPPTLTPFDHNRVEYYNARTVQTQKDLTRQKSKSWSVQQSSQSISSRPKSSMAMFKTEGWIIQDSYTKELLSKRLKQLKAKSRQSSGFIQILPKVVQQSQQSLLRRNVEKKQDCCVVASAYLINTSINNNSNNGCSTHTDTKTGLPSLTPWALKYNQQPQQQQFDVKACPSQQQFQYIKPQQLKPPQKQSFPNFHHHVMPTPHSHHEIQACNPNQTQHLVHGIQPYLLQPQQAQQAPQQLQSQQVQKTLQQIQAQQSHQMPQQMQSQKPQQVTSQKTDQPNQQTPPQIQSGLLQQTPRQGLGEQLQQDAPINLDMLELQGAASRSQETLETETETDSIQVSELTGQPVILGITELSGTHDLERAGDGNTNPDPVLTGQEDNTTSLEGNCKIIESTDQSTEPVVGTDIQEVLQVSGISRNSGTGMSLNSGFVGSKINKDQKGIVPNVLCNHLERDGIIPSVRETRGTRGFNDTGGSFEISGISATNGTDVASYDQNGFLLGVDSSTSSSVQYSGTSTVDASVQYTGNSTNGSNGILRMDAYSSASMPRVEHSSSSTMYQPYPAFSPFQMIDPSLMPIPVFQDPMVYCQALQQAMQSYMSGQRYNNINQNMMDTDPMCNKNFYPQKSKGKCPRKGSRNHECNISCTATNKSTELIKYPTTIHNNFTANQQLPATSGLRTRVPPAVEAATTPVDFGKRIQQSSSLEEQLCEGCKNSGNRTIYVPGSDEEDSGAEQQGKQGSKCDACGVRLGISSCSYEASHKKVEDCLLRKVYEVRAVRQRVCWNCNTASCSSWYSHRKRPNTDLCGDCYLHFKSLSKSKLGEQVEVDSKIKETGEQVTNQNQELEEQVTNQNQELEEQVTNQNLVTNPKQEKEEQMTNQTQSVEEQVTNQKQELEERVLSKKQEIEVQVGHLTNQDEQTDNLKVIHPEDMKINEVRENKAGSNQIHQGIININAIIPEVINTDIINQKLIKTKKINEEVITTEKITQNQEVNNADRINPEVFNTDRIKQKVINTEKINQEVIKTEKINQEVINNEDIYIEKMNLAKKSSEDDFVNKEAADAFDHFVTTTQTIKPQLITQECNSIVIGISDDVCVKTINNELKTENVGDEIINSDNCKN